MKKHILSPCCQSVLRAINGTLVDVYDSGMLLKWLKTAFYRINETYTLSSYFVKNVKSEEHF